MAEVADEGVHRGKRRELAVSMKDEEGIPGLMTRTWLDMQWLHRLRDLHVPWKLRFRHDMLVGVFLLGILVTAPSIWSEASPTDKDEYWLTLRTPLEMLEAGDWLTPRLNGEPRLRKPPLVYWAILGTYKLLGVSLAAARLWGVASGALLAVCCVLLSRELFGGRTFASGLMFLSTIGVAIQGRLAMLDLPLALLTTLGVWAFVRWTRTGSWRSLLGSSFFMGLSILLKWPVGLVFFGAAVLSRLWIFRQWHIAFTRLPQVMAAYVLFLAVCLPWPLAMMAQWPEFWTILAEEISSRNPGVHPLSSFVPVAGGVLALMFPWTPILPAAMAHGLKKNHSESHRECRWLAFWILAAMIPFLFIRSFERYMTPLMPAACVLCAHWLEDRRGIFRLRFLRVVLWLTVGFAGGCCLFFTWFETGLPWVCLCIVPMAAMAYAACSSPRFVQASICIMGVLALLMGGLYPSLEANVLPSHLGSVVGDLPAAVYKTSQPAMLSMRLRRSVAPVGDRSPEDHSFLRNLEGYVFMEKAAEEDFENAAWRLDMGFQKAGRFEILVSRGAKLGPAGTGWAHWKRAFGDRSLESLKTDMVYYRVSSRPLFLTRRFSDEPSWLSPLATTQTLCPPHP